MVPEPAESFVVPEIVRRRALTEGAESEAWLDGIESTVKDLAVEWNLLLGRVRSGGSEALVVEAVTDDGREAILKVGLPSSGAGRNEAAVLSAADGRGYARIYKFDRDRRTMLLERLGTPLVELRLPELAQLTIICRTLREAWLPISAIGDFMNGAEKAESLAEFITETWESTGRPCSEQVVARAIGYAQKRREAFSGETAVLGHGDGHEANILSVPGTANQRFKFIDPDGLVIERAYDLGVLMRGWGKSLLAGDAWSLARERARLLSSITGVDPQPIWEWGFIERLSTGLVLNQLGEHGESQEYLSVAELLAEGDARAG